MELVRFVQSKRRERIIKITKNAKDVCSVREIGGGGATNATLSVVSNYRNALCGKKEREKGITIRSFTSCFFSWFRGSNIVVDDRSLEFHCIFHRSLTLLLTTSFCGCACCEHRIVMSDFVVKEGWLLKKGEYIASWRPRYSQTI